MFPPVMTLAISCLMISASLFFIGCIFLSSAKELLAYMTFSLGTLALILFAIICIDALWNSNSNAGQEAKEIIITSELVIQTYQKNL